MLSLLSLALPLALAGSAIANPLMQRGDACLAAVTGSAALGDANLRKSHCSSFIKTIVTPAAKTVTVTITGAPSASSGWNNWKRDVTVCPNEVPNYASVCNEAAYKSACSVWGVNGETTFTIPATTTTKTIYVANGNGGIGNYGGPGGVCTSTNVITATTTVSACSGGTTTSTVVSTTTSVSTALSTVTVGNTPSITFTTTTTTSVGTVTSTVTNTATSFVGPGTVSTSTVTSTSTADLTTTAVSTTTVTVGASSTATVSTTLTLATTETTTMTSMTTITDPGVTTTQTLVVAANNTVVVTSTVTVDGTTSPSGSSGSPSTPSTGNCLTSTAQAEVFVNAFIDLLEYTSYNGTSAPPGRGYHYNVSATYLAENFQDYSDSINWMAGYNLGTVTFPNRAAFDYGQGLLQPELTMTTLNVDFGCKTIHWRWSALTSTYAHVTGINYFTLTDDLTQIQTNYAEFNNANWIQSFAPYNPSISCVVPGGLTKSQKRSSLARSY